MKTFKDNAARTWTVAVNVSAVKRVRGLLGIDLYKLIDDKMAGLGELLADPVSLVDVLYVLCKDEADRQGITDEQFGAAMGGDSLEAAVNAFVEELVDFFPDPRVRAGLSRVIKAGKEVGNHLIAMAGKKLDAMNPEAEAKRLIASFGNSPGSSE